MKHKLNYIYLIIVFIITTNISIFLDIPFLREILSFLLLTLLPGLLILKALKINNIDAIETLILSVGISVAFLMIYGLIINYILFEIGFKTPLSTLSFLISLDIALIVFSVIMYKLHQNLSFNVPDINLNNYEKVVLAVTFFFPSLSLFGAYMVNSSGNNILSMILLILTPLTVLLICFVNEKLSYKIYPPVIFLMSLSLILMAALRTQYILGVDSNIEYYYFLNTLQNLHWSIGFSQFRSALDACISISLLPTIYQSLMDVNPEMLFKVLYPLIYSVSPLAIYVISRKYVGELYAFLAAFFFISQLNFLWTTSNARTSLAVLFFALIIMLLLTDKIKEMHKSILVIIFVFSIVLSHYSTSFLVMGILLCSFIASWIISKFYAGKGVTLKMALTSSLILLFFVFTFLWYSQITVTTFNSITGFLVNKIFLFKSLFVSESKDVGISTALGEGLFLKSLPSQINFIFLWLTILSIGTTVLTLTLKYKQMVFPEITSEKFKFIREKFESDFFLFTLVNFTLLGITLTFPFLIIGYNIDRMFSTSLIVLSTSFVLGGLIISKVLSRFKTINAYLILLLILIPYFLSVTGFTYQVMGDPRSVLLNLNGDQYNMLYIHDSEFEGANWLKKYYKSNKGILTDFYGDKRLLSQGNILSTDSYYWILQKKAHGYIYLRYQNIIYGELVDYNNHIYKMNDFKGILNSSNKIYDGGYSQIFLTS